MRYVRSFGNTLAAMQSEQKLAMLAALFVAAVVVYGSVAAVVAPADDTRVCEVFRGACR